MLKPINNFEGYFISDDGKVYCNLGKGNRRNNRTVDMYELKPRMTRSGYCRVYARETGTDKRKDLYIHRLVAVYFIDNPNKKPCINHIDCDRTNNQASNLEWCTHKENNSYTMKLGRMQRDDLSGRFVSGVIHL